MERVRNARGLVKKRRDVKNLKEGNIDEAVLNGNVQPASTQAVGMYLSFQPLSR